MDSALTSLRVFTEDQRVSHTAIVEHKRLRHARSIIKTQQDSELLQAVTTNTEKSAIKRRTKTVYGLPETTDELANGTKSRATAKLMKRVEWSEFTPA
jgi:hypothetical protein